jgi:hypothetical protein
MYMFYSYSLRAVLNILSFIICRLYIYSIMVFRFSISDGGICRDVRVLLVDDTRIRIGSGGGYCILL